MRIFFILLVSFFLIPSENSYSQYANKSTKLLNTSCPDRLSDLILDVYFSSTMPKTYFHLISSYFNSKSQSERNNIKNDLQNFPLRSQENKDRMISDWKNSNYYFYETVSGKNSPNSRCLVEFEINGTISNSDYLFIKDVVEEFASPPFIKINLNSSGGEVLSAIKIGELVRNNYGITRVVGYKGKCFSACVLIYAAGIAKNIDIGDDGNWLPIGVHQHFLESTSVQTMSIEDGINYLKGTSKEIEKYFEFLGISRQLLSISLSVPKNSLRILTEKELKLYLPFAVAEYAAIIPDKVKYEKTNLQNKTQIILHRLSDLVVLYDISEPKYLIKKLHKEFDFSFGNKWALAPTYALETGMWTQSR